MFDLDLHSILEGSPENLGEFLEELVRDTMHDTIIRFSLNRLSN